MVLVLEFILVARTFSFMLSVSARMSTNLGIAPLNTKAFTVEGKVSRKDFGLVWNAATEGGGVVVSDEVKIHANVEFIKAA